MMKKTFTLLCLIFTVILLVVPTMSASAAGSGSVALSGPATIRSGDTITITLNLTSSNITAGEASVTYDPSQLRLVSATPYSQGGWSLTPAHSSGTVKFGGYTTGAKWNGTKPFMTIKFKVENLAENTPVTITTSHCVFSDGSADATLPNASYSKNISAPLSGNADLSALTVSNAVISPSFSAGTTSYSAGTVEFSVSKLNINVVTEDPRAKVYLSGDNLAVGNNTVKVTVKAENGATKTYSIKVTRKQDPNYKASSNTALSSLSVDGFIISPPFQNGIDDYVVWLPYETTAITARASAADAKATVSVEGGAALEAGRDNTVTITCTAEDGTKKTYRIIAKRASQDGSEIQPEKTEEPDDEALSTSNDTEKGKEIKPVAVVALCLLFLIVGALLMFILIRFGIIDC